MIRITALASNDIEDVSAMDIQDALKALGIRVAVTTVRKQTAGQYRKALAPHVVKTG